MHRCKQNHAQTDTRNRVCVCVCVVKKYTGLANAERNASVRKCTRENMHTIQITYDDP